MMAVIKSGFQDAARGIRRLNHAESFVGVSRQRLFAKNVLAGLQGAESHGGVHVSRRSHNDETDAGVFRNRFPVVDRPRANLVSQVSGFLKVRVRNSHHSGFRMGVSDARTPRADQSGSNNPHAPAFHEFFAFRFNSGYKAAAIFSSIRLSV
jgi:hypothetical protein